MSNLGHEISDQTVGNILKAHGIEPAPQRKRVSTWKTFLKAHWDVLGAIDFTTVEVWTKGGLVTYYLLFVVEIATRRVCFAGCTPNPDTPWMMQVARNLTDAEDGFVMGKRYVLLDRDGKFCPAFQVILKTAGVEAVPLPPKSPNLNAHLERFHRSIQEECLDRMIFFGEAMLRKAVTLFLEHYHQEAITRGWRIEFWCRVPKWDRRRGRSNAGSDSEGCCDTITGLLPERAMMFTRWKRWLVAWAERQQQREIQRLHEEAAA